MYNICMRWRDIPFVYKYFIPVVIMLLTASSISALDAGQDSDCKVFTNKDLEEYKRPSDTTKKTDDEVSRDASTKKVIHVRTRKQKRDEDYRNRKEEEKEAHLQQYWCRKGTQYRRKVEKAKMRVKVAEEYLSDVEHDSPSVSTNSCKRKGAENRLKRAQQKLKEAEDDLSFIEDEAHRQWIAPGWLRCQF
jgi:phosphoenolpyruvate synthase/pyruvate phosphate dikinase